MNKRQVIVLWIIALVLGIAVAAVKFGLDQAADTRTARSAGDTLFTSFPAQEVASIEIKGSANTATLRKKDGSWVVAEREDYPANVSSVNEMLRTLSELKVTQGIEAGASFAPRFGMDEAASSAEERGLTATFNDPSGKELAKVSLGKNIGADTGGFGPVSGRYIRNHADTSGFYATSEMFPAVSEDPKRWISDEFIKIERIRSIALSEPGSEEIAWKLTRDTVEKEFALDGAAEGETLDTAATSPLNSLFAFSRFEDVVPAAKVEERAEPGQTRSLTIETFDDLTYQITFTPIKPDATAVSDDEEVMPPAEDNYLFTVNVSGDLATERVKDEDESPEDAKTKDEAFATRLKELNEKLAKEKTFSGRTFEVSRFTIDPVLKERSALLKQEEAPAAGRPGSASPGSVTAVTPPISIPPLEELENAEDPETPQNEEE